MKKRVLSLFMALMLCLTLLPTAALADELGPVDGTSAVETADAGADADAETEPDAEAEAEAAAKAEAEAEAAAKAEAEAKAKADAEAAAAVQAQIDKLPSLGELKGMDSDTLNEAYMAVQSAYDAYEDLTAEQQAQITGAECFEALFGWFNSQVAVLDTGDVTGSYDTFDANGNITSGNSRTGPSFQDSNKDVTLETNKFYIVEKDATVAGNLTIDGSAMGGLVLCDGATLTVHGALIHNGGDRFCIFGQTLESNSKGTGKLVIDNRGKDGAAIRSDSSTSTAPTLNISSGELEIYSSSVLVDNVRLNSELAVHAATLNGEKVLCAAWSGKTSLEGTSLVLEYCNHSESDDQEYFQDGISNGAHYHHRHCKACGFEWPSEKCSIQLVDLDSTTHTMGCDACGYEEDPVQHTYSEIPAGGGYTAVPTPDGKQHSTKACSVCGWPDLSSEDALRNHSYDESGTCTGCGFTPVAKDTNGNLYDDIEEAIKSGVKELWLVSEATGASQNILQKSLKIDESVNLTLHMNGVKLEGISGSPALTVSGGTLTVKDDANIVSPDITGGATEFSATPAIEVTSGSLIFEGAVTATGGKYSNKVASAIEVSGGKLTFNGEVNAKAESIDTAQPSGYTLAPAINVTGGEVTFAQKLTATGGIFKDGTNLSKQEPAVYATSGTLDFKGDLDLNGGLTLTKSAKLANLLTQGTFSVSAGTGSSPLSVKDSSVYKKVSDLLAEGYAYALKNDNSKFTNFSGAYTCSDDVTIVEHTHEWKQDETYTYLHSCACGKSENHEYDSSTGKCKICQSECPHESVDNTGECFTCHAQMAVKITASDNTVTYGTDFKSAMRNATNGTKITLLADVPITGRAGISGDDTTVTLDLNGHKITSGWLDVGGKDTNGTYTACTLKIIGKGSYEPPMYGGIITVDLKATLDLSDWEGGTISTINISDSSDYDETTREAAVIVGPKAGTIGKL
uniref:hypothetical protein n=1 Tax=uncultured Oscillibacter sp. TaxID=876091 RepID=UPI0025E41C6B